MKYLILYINIIFILQTPTRFVNKLNCIKNTSVLLQNVNKIFNFLHNQTKFYFTTQFSPYVIAYDFQFDMG